MGERETLRKLARKTAGRGKSACTTGGQSKGQGGPVSPVGLLFLVVAGELTSSDDVLS